MYNNRFECILSWLCSFKSSVVIGINETYRDKNGRAGRGEWSLPRSDEVGRGGFKSVLIGDIGRGEVIHLIIQHYTSVCYDS